MLFDLTFPCYLTTFSGKNSLSGKVICTYFCPAYRSSPVFRFQCPADTGIKLCEYSQILDKRTCSVASEALRLAESIADCTVPQQAVAREPLLLSG
jgi:hypothetical protein